jgi:hypothetical protein
MAAQSTTFDNYSTKYAMIGFLFQQQAKSWATTARVAKRLSPIESDPVDLHPHPLLQVQNTQKPCGTRSDGAIGVLKQKIILEIPVKSALTPC